MKSVQYLIVSLSLDVGKSIDTVTIEGSTNADLAEMMVGHQVSFKTDKIPSNPKEVVPFY